MASRSWNAPKALPVTFVFGEEKLIDAFAVEPVIAQKIVARFDEAKL